MVNENGLSLLNHRKMTKILIYYSTLEARNSIFKRAYNAQKNIKIKIQVMQYQNQIVKDCQKPKLHICSYDQREAEEMFYDWKT